MQRLQQVLRFLRFYFSAHTRYNVHSPFVFAFTEAVLEDERWFYAFGEWEALRRFLLKDGTKIPITDFGAGSQVSMSKERSLASLARYSANRPRTCQMLFRIVDLYKPKRMVELGTSLGISTGYQAAAALRAQFVTIEGCPSVARFAAKNFELMKVGHVRLVQGRFEDRLPGLLDELREVDYVFFDGNHRKEPTLQYFETCLAHAHARSVFVFDDIHWSKGMEEAWASIQNHPKVTLTIDLYFFGVVFFRPEQQAKEHFKLVPWLWKPWRIGFLDLFK